MTPVEIEQLQSRLRERTESALRANNFAETARLAAIADRVATLRAEIDERCASLRTIAADVFPAVARCGDPLPVQPRVLASPRDGLVLQILWTTNGPTATAETIHEHTGASTLRRFLERVHEVMGERRLALLHRVVTGRGPLISQSPDADFVNRADGSVYSHKRIRDKLVGADSERHAREKAANRRSRRPTRLALLPGRACTGD